MSSKKEVDRILQEYLAEEDSLEPRNGGTHPSGSAFASLLAGIERRFAIAEVDAAKRHNEVMLITQATSARINMISHRLDFVEKIQEKLAESSEITGRHEIYSAKKRAEELEKEKKHWLGFLIKGAIGAAGTAVVALVTYYLSHVTR